MSKPQTLVRIRDALFRSLDSVSAFSKGKPPAHVFQRPIRNLDIHAHEKWAVVGAQKTTFLQCLRGEYLPDPPLALTYPFLAGSPHRWASSAIQFLNFNKRSLPKQHISARYEFFKEDLDETVHQFVTGQITNANNQPVDARLVAAVLDMFHLTHLKDSWLMGLSNGQLRRARFAQALVKEPELLLVDDPFLGLDPEATRMISGVLGRLGHAGVSNAGDTSFKGPHVIVGLRVQDEVPEWITHVAIVNDAETGVWKHGSKEALLADIEHLRSQEEQLGVQDYQHVSGSVVRTLWRGSQPTVAAKRGTSHIRFDNISIAYRGKDIIRDLALDIKFGEKWHIRGNNGAGKTTLLSLVMADHPQSWNSRVVIDGTPRKTGRQSYFDINAAIGFSSPELHAIFPARLTVRQALLTAFNGGGGSSFIVPKDNSLTEAQLATVDLLLDKFNLQGMAGTCFGDASISNQKLVLFVRAIAKAPEILILDEAFSCMDEELIVLCRSVLREWPGTVLSIAHLKNETPDCNKFVRLIGPGEYEIGDMEEEH